MKAAADVIALILGPVALVLLVAMYLYAGRLRRQLPPDPEEDQPHIYIGGSRFSHRLIMSAVNKIRERQDDRRVG